MDALDQLFKDHIAVTPGEIAQFFRVTKLTIARKIKDEKIQPISRYVYRLTREQVRRLFPHS